MFARPLRFTHARQTAASLGWLAENGTAPAAAAAPRRLSLVSRETGTDGARVELLSAEAAADRRAAWLDLVSRRLEPNVFLEPDFALPAAQHIVSARRPVFLFVTAPARAGKPGQLIGAAALHLPRWPGRRLAKAWCSQQAALGLPLLDHTRGGEALDLMLGWLTREHPLVSAVLFPNMPSAGPTMQLIRDRTASGVLRFQSFDPHARAALNGKGDVQALLARGLSLKHLKKIERQRRRLAGRGTLAYVRREASEVTDAAEQFLALEASGWKGKRGTALLKDPGLATFTRSMTRLLARNGQCHIDSLELDGKPIAMGIILTSGQEASFWKIAYDERYAAFSPGVQLIIDFMRRQIADGTITRTDSCAAPDHPMIDGLWPDRLEIADVMLAPSATHAEVFAAVALRETLRRGFRAAAKRVYQAAIGSRRG